MSSSKYAAFLRGMNVGGHRITSRELQSHFETMGFDQVACFRASGNVVFCAEREPVAKLAKRIEAALLASLGYAVPTFLRSAKEVRAAAEHQPFAAAAVEASAGKLQVMLLLEKPTPRAQKDALALATAQDQLVFNERELYWLPSGGILDTALDLKALGTLLGPTTVRTKGTIEQIAKKHFADIAGA